MLVDYGNFQEYLVCMHKWQYCTPIKIQLTLYVVGSARIITRLLMIRIYTQLMEVSYGKKQATLSPFHPLKGGCQEGLVLKEEDMFQKIKTSTLKCQARVELSSVKIVYKGDTIKHHARILEWFLNVNLKKRADLGWNLIFLIGQELEEDLKVVEGLVEDEVEVVVGDLVEEAIEVVVGDLVKESKQNIGRVLLSFLNVILNM